MTDDLEDFFSEGVKWRQKLQGMLLLQNIKFTEHNIEWAYNRGLKSSSSPVPDGRPAELLKQPLPDSFVIKCLLIVCYVKVLFVHVPHDLSS